MREESIQTPLLVWSNKADFEIIPRRRFYAANVVEQETGNFPLSGNNINLLNELLPGQINVDGSRRDLGKARVTAPSRRRHKGESEAGIYHE